MRIGFSNGVFHRDAHVDSATLSALLVTPAEDVGGGEDNGFSGVLSPMISDVHFDHVVPTRFNFFESIAIVNCKGDFEYVKKLLEACRPGMKFGCVKFKYLPFLIDAGIGPFFQKFTRYLGGDVVLEIEAKSHEDYSGFMGSVMSHFRVYDPTSNPAVSLILRDIRFEGVWHSGYNECWSRVGHSFEKVWIFLGRYSDTMGYDCEVSISGINETAESCPRLVCATNLVRV